MVWIFRLVFAPKYQISYIEMALIILSWISKMWHLFYICWCPLKWVSYLQNAHHPETGMTLSPVIINSGKPSMLKFVASSHCNIPRFGSLDRQAAWVKTRGKMQRGSNQSRTNIYFDSFHYSGVNDEKTSIFTFYVQMSLNTSKKITKNRKLALWIQNLIVSSWKVGAYALAAKYSVHCNKS